MIGDLSNQPEDIVIKLFSTDPAQLNELGPRVEDAIKKIPGVVDTQNGIDNTISGPATNFQVDPVVAGRLGFTPTEVAEDATAILDGLPTPDPMIANGRPYTIRLRLPDRQPQLSGCHPEHGLQLQYGSHGFAWLAGAGHRTTAAERDTQGESAATHHGHGPPGLQCSRCGPRLSHAEGAGDGRCDAHSFQCAC